MKIKIVALFVLLVSLCLVLSSCVLFEIIEFANNILGFFGGEEGDTTNNFEINFQLPDPNRCTNHIITPLSAIGATCQAPGMSAGQVCSKCGTVIVAQVELPALDHVYDDVLDKDCNNCGYIREIKCEHIETKSLEGRAPTCTVTGRTSGEICLGCSKIVSGFEIIETIPHAYDNERDDSCSACGYIRKLECFHDATKKLDPKDPTCTETGLTKGIVCIHCGEVILSQKEISTIDHKESDLIVDKAPTNSVAGVAHTECVMCHVVLRTTVLEKIDLSVDENASTGLIFVLNDDQNSYTLIDMGNCLDSEVVIPRYFNGLPVTKIDDGAFLNRSDVISVIIPEGIATIGNGAFRECINLKNIIVPSSIISIGEYAFYNCALTSIVLPYGLKEIKQYTFYSCNFTSIHLPYGLISIEKGAFAECDLLSSITLPSSLENIGKEAFYNTKNLVNIIFPRSIKTIGDKAFNGSGDGNTAKSITMFSYVEKIGAYAFTTNTTIIYKGSFSQWNSIYIDPRNYQYNVVTLNGSFVD